MSKLDLINELFQLLDDEKSLTENLQTEIKTMSDMLYLEEFIPDELGMSVIEKLTEMRRLLQSVGEKFSLLEMGKIPSGRKEAARILEVYREKIHAEEKYTDAVRFFMTLQSDDRDTQMHLENRKKQLARIDFSKMDFNDIKSVVERYVCLQEAYYETIPEKRFSLIYGLAGEFEEPIARALQFGTLKTETEQLAGTLEEDQESVGQMEKEVAVQDVKNAEEKKTEELDGSELTESFISGEKSEEKEEVEQNIWKDIGINAPETVIHRENSSLLKIEVSPKAANKFGVKEFKKDMRKQAIIQKIVCLQSANEECGFSKESIALWEKKDEGYFDLAADKLFQQGYLQKYIVEGMGEFFTLSPKGEKAFKSREASSFIYGTSKRKWNEKQNMGQPIKDSGNAAIARILRNSCYKRMLNINSKYSFSSQTSCIDTDWFSLMFPESVEGKDAEFIGIVSEDPKQFLTVYKHILENKEADVLIILAAVHEEAANIAKWIKTAVKRQLSVWYCGFADKTVFDADTDEVVITKKADKAVSTAEHPQWEEQELPEEQKEHEKTSEEKEEITEICKEKLLNSQSEPEAYGEDYEKMLVAGKPYAAAAYLKVLSTENPSYRKVYRQLAYALNDPMNNCSYSSDIIFRVYYSEESPVSDYFVVSAAVRNYFYDQFSYDYSLRQLQDMVSGNRVLHEIPALDRIVYTLQHFKEDNHRGIDRYADYREKERTSWEKRLDEIRREAKGYYDNYSMANVKENAAHKRFIETSKLLLGPGSDLSEFLKAVSEDNRELKDMLEDFLKEHYIKNQATICEENIDSGKIDVVLDTHWNLAAKNMRFVRKSSDLMGSLRMNLFKRVRKIAAVLCSYVSLLQSSIPDDADPALREYRKVRNTLIDDIEKAMYCISQKKAEDEIAVQAGKEVLKETLQELKARLEGNYKEGNYKYFYINFLKNDKVLLDEEFLPILEEVPQLEELSACKRIHSHCKEQEKEWKQRLDEIFRGGDDYGSAELILRYLKQQTEFPNSEEYQQYSVEKAITFPQKDIENQRREFIEDLELAQSYGQIDNTAENIKESMIQIMDNWYTWALETKNYGFFRKILGAFKKKIHEDASVIAVELNHSLEIYLRKNQEWQEDRAVADAVEQIRSRIKQQNYAAAEDLLNRLLTKDLDSETDLLQNDYLMEFLDEYDINYRKTANAGMNLKSLVSASSLNTSRLNKDTKGADKLLENWPRGTKAGANRIRMLLDSLGFATDTVKMEAPIQGKIESYLITLRRPENGRKSNYKHPISAFGSEAEEKGFRVVCIFGKMDADRLIDTFKEIGNAKNTIVLLDYSLTLADRRTLARKTKMELTGKIFAVIDRVVLVYLAKHYMETAVNRMLMAVIMPFALYQPYIVKSADVMPQEIFIGRKIELEKIESPTGVNIVYGGRQLGKTALLRMAKNNVDHNENGDRAVIINAWGKNYRETARAVAEALYDEGILKEEIITEQWSELARCIKRRLNDPADSIPYLLLMIDEADVFIESCEEVGYEPFNALKDIQSVGSRRFKFVVAGLRNIVRFKRMAALDNNKVLPHLESLTVKPFKAMEARELLEVPLAYLGFRFQKDMETEVLISTILGTTNYFPGLIQLYCKKLLDAMKRDYAGYSESETPPYYVRKEQIKKILAEESLQQDIREKFFITLKVGEDDYYYIIALLVAYHYHQNKSQNGCSVEELRQLADTFSIGKLAVLNAEKIFALMEEMSELNVLQHTGDGRYRFTRHSFCQMMGTIQQIDDELLNYMED